MTTAPVAFRSGHLRIGLRADVLALGGVVALVGVLAVLTWGTWGDLDSDTGYDVVAGARVADGEVPYRDFTYYYGPLAPALSGLAALIGGPGFWPAVGLGLVVALAIIGATYALARIVAGPLGALLAASITAAVAFIPDNYSYVLPHTGDATLGVLLLLVLLLALWRYASSARSRWLVAVGGCLGLLTLTKPEPLAGALVAVAFWLLLRRRAGASLGREAALVGAPALLIAGTVYGAFLAVVSPHRLLLENLYPVDVFAAAGNKLNHGRVPLTASSFAELSGKLLLYAAGVAALLVAARLLARPGAVRRVALGALCLGAALAVAASFLRPEAMRHGLQFAYGWIPAGAVLAVAVLVWRLHGRRQEWSPRVQLELAGATALAVLAATAYPGFFPHAPHEQIAAYFIPLAAVFLVRLHLGELGRRRAAYALGAAWIAFLAAAGMGLTIKDARADSATVRGPGGALAETPREASLYRTALRWIDRSARPGEPIFVAPMMTALYPLSGHRSPLEEITMLPGALPSVADERRAIAALETARVRLVVTDDRVWPAYDHLAFGESFDRVLAGWIASHFERVATVHTAGWTSFEGTQPPRTLFVWLRRGA